MYAFLPRTSTRDKNGYMRQSNDFTCGPVSLANLAEHFCGSPPLSERDVARMAGTTYEGTTMTGLIRAAHELGLRVISCRKLTLDELERSGKPAIVFISTIPTVRHATLLVAFRGDRVAFVDPDRSYGYTEMTRARFDRVWYGKTLILAR
jgi:predicted double-glycine peptidase